MGYIYTITNIKNGKKYIGSTNNFKRRKSQHLHALRNNKHLNKHLQNAWNKYGEDSFEFKIIKEVDDIMQFKIEQNYIDKMHTCENHIGYNSRSAVKQDSDITMTKLCDICNEKSRKKKFKPNFNYCTSECKLMSCYNGDIHDFIDNDEDEIDQADYEWELSNYDIRKMSDWDVDDFTAYDYDERMSK